MPKMTSRQMYDSLQAHATKNYEYDRWDITVECVGYEDFLRDMGEGSFSTLTGAIKYYHEGNRVHKEQEEDIRGHAGLNDGDM